MVPIQMTNNIVYGVPKKKYMYCDALESPVNW